MPQNSVGRGSEGLRTKQYLHSSPDKLNLLRLDLLSLVNTKNVEGARISDPLGQSRNTNDRARESTSNRLGRDEIVAEDFSHSKLLQKDRIAESTGQPSCTHVGAWMYIIVGRLRDLMEFDRLGADRGGFLGRWACPGQGFGGTDGEDRGRGRGVVLARRVEETARWSLPSMYEDGLDEIDTQRSAVEAVEAGEAIPIPWHAVGWIAVAIRRWSSVGRANIAGSSSLVEVCHPQTRFSRQRMLACTATTALVLVVSHDLSPDGRGRGWSRVTEAGCQNAAFGFLRLESSPCSIARFQKEPPHQPVSSEYQSLPAANRRHSACERWHVASQEAILQPHPSHNRLEPAVLQPAKSFVCARMVEKWIDLLEATVRSRPDTRRGGIMSGHSASRHSRVCAERCTIDPFRSGKPVYSAVWAESCSFVGCKMTVWARPAWCSRAKLPACRKSSVVRAEREGARER
ncbi:hypothetical protein M409DRAFT_54096 [Zasmidium cellare ATCC 36951]|uniref:Uncharacterized protein n=1 Tax=Zasmidium cellare ATCC 36951 TaxID=1080233 RepID=A0A6A6CJU1_ZASCE|nr:uncharacterized protein M409DRAFT_54096 [Zasmidium cellare ATCC 36951]KAF2167497.1 hypothetical protein M409DRAFT_54096 [Zasmidium cellare ATCC 36951]